MSCQSITRHPARRSGHSALTIALLLLAPGTPAHAQQPVPRPLPQQPTPVPQPTPGPIPAPPPAQPIMAYRAPVIALVQPPAGQALPQDTAVVILRFAGGEPSDPLDASSFGVWVNGANRSALFQVAGTEAWGPLADARAGTLAPGVYQVAARICSTRGACGSTSATVTVVATEATPAATEQGVSRRQRLIDLLLAGVRRLVGP